LRAFSSLAQHLQPRILIKVSDPDPEWQTPVINYPIVSQHAFGNSGHLIEIIAAGVDHCQLRLAHVLGIIFRVAIRKAHVALDCKQVGEQPAGEHDDQPGVREMNSQFPPGKPETFYVRRNKINQQHSADEMPARKNGDLESASVRRPPDEHALEITLLRFVDPEMDLRQRAGKDQRHPCRKTHDRQLQ
jgi:hypothetical protein